MRLLVQKFLSLRELPFILKVVGHRFQPYLNYSLCYCSLHYCEMSVRPYSTGGHSFNLAADIKGIISLMAWTSIPESYVFILPPRVGEWVGGMADPAVCMVILHTENKDNKPSLRTMHQQQILIAFFRRTL